jgi:hypothetical protein
MDIENKPAFSLNIDELKSLIEEGVTNALAKAPQKNEQEKLLSRREVAKIFKISLVTLTDWVNEGLIESEKIKSRVYFRESKVFEALKTVKKYKRA